MKYLFWWKTTYNVQSGNHPNCGIFWYEQGYVLQGGFVYTITQPMKHSNSAFDSYFNPCFTSPSVYLLGNRNNLHLLILKKCRRVYKRQWMSTWQSLFRLQLSLTLWKCLWSERRVPSPKPWSNLLLSFWICWRSFDSLSSKQTITE